jgi:hypothetical protein
MTTTTATHPMTRVPNRFGGYYTDESGRPLAWTDGHALVVVGATTLADAAEAMCYAQPTESALPDRPAVRRVIEGERRAVHIASAIITRKSKPCAAIVARAEEEKRSRIVAAEQALESAIVQLANERARRKEAAAAPRGAIVGVAGKTLGALQDKVSEYRQDLRAAKDWTTAELGGFIVGPAHFDMRVVQRALRALGASEGTLHVTADPLAPALLTTKKGIGIVMPYRA